MAQIGSPERIHEIEPAVQPWELPEGLPERVAEPVEVPEEEEQPVGARGARYIDRKGVWQPYE